MPLIQVDMFEGRTVDQKRALVAELTDGFVRACGGTPEQVTIVITDKSKEDWGSKGILAVDR